MIKATVTIALAAALSAAALAQAPTPPPPKPRVISKPKTPTPKPATKPRKPKPAELDLQELPALPSAAPADPLTAQPASANDPAKPPAAEPKPAAKKTTPASAAAITAYTAKVKTALGKDWLAALQPRAEEFTPGNVSVFFRLDHEGHVAEFKTTENSSNEAFAKFCEQHIRAVVFEPPPARALTDGTVEIPFTFWLY